MCGDKLKLLADTVRFIVKQLRAVDTLSIVTFDSNVNTVLPLTEMTSSGKHKATKACDALRSGSATNLSGGLFQGCQILNKTMATTAASPSSTTHRVPSVLLLTDGIANEGVTELSALIQATVALMGDHKYPIYSFGYGADHQPALLKALSDVGGGGVYYFVEKIETVPAAFGDCLGGLLTTVAQNMTLTVSVPASAAGFCTIDNVDTTYTHQLSADHSSVVINLGDLQAEESRDIVMTLNLNPLPAAIPIGVADSAIPHLTATLNYVNLIMPGFSETKAELCINRPVTVAADQPASELVREQLARVTAARALKEALAMAERGDLASARISLQACMASPLMAQARNSVNLTAELMDCATNLESSEKFRRAGHHKLAAYAQSHCQQRANNISDEMDDKPDLQTTSYVTPAKKASRAAFLSFVKKWREGEKERKRVDHFLVYVEKQKKNANKTGL